MAIGFPGFYNTVKAKNKLEAQGGEEINIFFQTRGVILEGVQWQLGAISCRLGFLVFPGRLFDRGFI